jgi:hypothetical protein
MKSSLWKMKIDQFKKTYAESFMTIISSVTEFTSQLNSLVPIDSRLGPLPFERSQPSIDKSAEQVKMDSDAFDKSTEDVKEEMHSFESFESFEDPKVTDHASQEDIPEVTSKGSRKKLPAPHKDIGAGDLSLKDVIDFVEKSGGADSPAVQFLFLPNDCGGPALSGRRNATGSILRYGMPLEVLQ